jgi:ATP-dependent RNA helicase RhlE
MEIGGCNAPGKRERRAFPSSNMLRKFIAKLRETISPSPKAKKPTEGLATSKPTSRQPSRERYRDRGGKGHGPSQGKPHEPREPRAAGPGGQSHGHGPGPHKEPRERGPAGHGQGQGHGHGPTRSSGYRGRERRPAEPTAHEPMLHREPEPAAPPPEVPKMATTFSALGLSDAVAYAVEQKGYVDPTPIQAQAIPVVLTGRDVMGAAQTGTGKTAAFALPILQRLGTHGSLRCLILEPTRELALQVEQAFLEYGKFTNLRTAIVYGGVGYGKQLEALRRGVDILVATPGRLLDHLEQRNTSLRDVQILVLDEVDRMLDMGFLPDVKRIVTQCPRERQTLFFSATLPPEIAQLASWAVRDPVRIELGHRAPASTVSHAFYPVVASQKFDLLCTLLSRTQFESVLIFCRTKAGADRVASWLKGQKHTVGVMHSDRNQSERVEALNGFKSGKFEVLVATDIAARGLDIQGISHVINYDVPENPEDYVHRIGRTGRAQKLGEAFTLVTEDNVRDARSIERFIGANIERKKLEGFDYIYSALFDVETLDTIAPVAAQPTSRLHRRGRR